MGICGSSVNLTDEDEKEDEENWSVFLAEKPKSGTWDIASLEIAVINLSERLGVVTKRALALKRGKRIKAARALLRSHLKPMKAQLEDLQHRLSTANTDAEKWTDAEKRDILPIQKSHLRMVPQGWGSLEDLSKRFDILEKSIGDGMCGTVRRAKCKSTGAVFALKTLSKESIDPEVLEILRLEVDILAALDHPNVVHIIEAFEGHKVIHILLELGKGGDLFEYVRTIKDKKLPLSHARWVVWQMVLAVSHIHAQGVVHRDLKLENFVFVDSPEAHLKSPTPDSRAPLPRLQLIDFGLAKQWQPPGSVDCIQVKKMNTVVGTLDTSAPEVRDRNVMYTSKCDMWSIGAVTFKLISGRYPFEDTSREETLKNIRAGKYAFDDTRGWAGVPENARDFVRKLLVVDPSSRMSAREALQHPWLHRIQSDFNNDEEFRKILSAVDRFSDLSAIQRTALLIHAHFVHCGKTKSASNGLHQVFLSIDKDHSGDLTKAEFGAAVKRVHRNISTDKIDALYDAIDQDNSGLVHYSEFLAAGLFAQPSEVIRYDLDVDAVFERLDTDKSGSISTENLKEIFGESCREEQIRAILHPDMSTESTSSKNDDATATKVPSRSKSIDKAQFRKLMGRVRDACLSTSTPPAAKDSQ